MDLPMNRLPGLALLSFVFLYGCDQVAEFYSCPNPVEDHVDADGRPDPCFTRSERPSDAGVPCSGECVPLAPAGWSDAMLLWSGPVFAAPPCPDRAPSPAYQGWADLVPAGCSECACDSTSGSCALPSAFVASSETCPGDGPGAVHTFFTTPDPWDGSCTAQGAVPAGQLCNGVPCVRSLTIDPLTMTESACTPSQTPVPKSSWQTAAVACRGTAMPPCTDPGTLCVPAAEPPEEGFSLCIFNEGDRDCPPAWPDRHVFFKDFDDSPMCTPCACSDPIGGACSALVSVYQDNACSAPLVSYFATSADPAAQCHSVFAGAALGSKAVTDVSYQPGSCTPSGGDLVGAPLPIEPSTFCCRE
jgi:hypothetical protein